jgi:hypothetical protein
VRPQLHFPFAGESGRARPLYDTRLHELSYAMTQIAERRADAEALHLARRISPSHISGVLCGANNASMTLNPDDATCRHCLATLFNEQKAEERAAQGIKAREGGNSEGGSIEDESPAREAGVPNLNPQGTNNDT